MENNEKIKNGLDELFCLEEVPEGNLQLPTPYLVQYYKDKKNRVIWINKDIDDDLFEEMKMIIQYNREDEEAGIPKEERKPIHIYLHSYRGSLDSAFAFVDIMNLSTTPLYCYNLNACMSAAALIFVNGHKRFAMPLSTLLFHSGSGSNGRSYEQVVAQTENYKHLMDMLKTNIMAHTKIDKKTLDRQMKKEWYLYIDEQQKWGCVDVVLTDIKQLFE